MQAVHPGVRRFLGGDDVALRCLIVVAHPDDETLGAGALMQRPWEFAIVHVTDGAPRDPTLWNAPFPDRQAYARARRDELAGAMARTRAASISLRTLDIADQEVVQNLAWVARALAPTIATVAPDVVLTHPYEGGHPDHDAVACAVRAACLLVADAGGPRPDVLEMAYYHAAGGELVHGRFAEDPDRPERVVVLDDSTRARKAAMLDCFASQRDVLGQFPLDTERYRVAAHYDFGAPPHAGALYYERMGWSDGAGWRAQVERAAVDLDLAARLCPPSA